MNRTTRFSTSVPAAEVLQRIADIVNETPYPLKKPFHRIRQRARVTWDDYKLEVLRGSVAMCTVRVYLMRTGLYMVEFLRGQLNTFDFKRFYEMIRARLSELVKSDYTLRMLDSAAHVRSKRGSGRRAQQPQQPTHARSTTS